MPYIKQDRRDKLQQGESPLNSGELNYLITKLLVAYWKNGERNYQSQNDIVGAIEGAKAEFQRRIVAPYEDQKMEVNGDVY